MNEPLDDIAVIVPAVEQDTVFDQFTPSPTLRKAVPVVEAVQDTFTIVMGCIAFLSSVVVALPLNVVRVEVEIMKPFCCISVRFRSAVPS